ncbi:MAG: CAP domain-containing protein [Myxococcota bacterium]
MQLTLNSVVLLVAVSGYGDVDEAGHPSWAERDVHLWTNAVRVQPDAFQREYQLGGCSMAVFSQDEQTPKGLVYYAAALNQVAREHSVDMATNSFFSHSSSDGTAMVDRVAPVYGSRMVSENIARGYPDPKDAVLSGWMCSTSGHRANIMNGAWSELGAGVSGDFYTQNFGGKSIYAPGPVAMGNHTPEMPATTVDFYADWQDDAPPKTLQVVLDGEPTDLTHVYGETDRGVYTGRALVDETLSCHAYYFRWIDADDFVGGFPQDGSYLFGDCPDDAVMWRSEQQNFFTDAGEDGREAGCSALTGSVGVAGLLVSVLGALRRRRRTL